MAIENLDGVKDELYKAFNQAILRHSSYTDADDAYSSGETTNFAIQNRIAIGTLAQAIAAVECESKGEKFATLPGKRSVR